MSEQPTENLSSLRTVDWKDNKVVMIDQTKLPNDFVFVESADHVNFSAAIATITFTGDCVADETITIISADGTSKTFTAKSSSPSAAAGTFANAFAGIKTKLTLEELVKVNNLNPDVFNGVIDFEVTKPRYPRLANRNQDLQ